MPLLIFRKPLAKSFIAAHTRKTKDGKIIQVAAYSDKRLRKDAHTVTHNKDINHLSEDDRANWERLHKEQHVLHHVDKATHERRIKEYEANIEHHKKKAAHHEAQRDIARAKGDKAALSEHNVALTHHHNRAQAWANKLAPHERQLAKLNKKLDGIKAMKEKLWAGSGDVGEKEKPKNLGEDNASAKSIVEKQDGKAAKPFSESFEEFKKENPDLPENRAKSRWAGGVHDAWNAGYDVPEKTLAELKEIRPAFIPDGLADDGVLLDKLSEKITDHIENEIERKQYEHGKELTVFKRKETLDRKEGVDFRETHEKHGTKLRALTKEIEELKDELYQRKYNNKLNGKKALEVVSKYRDLQVKKHNDAKSKNLSGDKPSETVDKNTNAREKKEPAETPKDGDTNAEGLVFRNGRWHREGGDKQNSPETSDVSQADYLRQMAGKAPTRDSFFKLVMSVLVNGASKAELQEIQDMFGLSSPPKTKEEVRAASDKFYDSQKGQRKQRRENYKAALAQSKQRRNELFLADITDKAKDANAAMNAHIDSVDKLKDTQESPETFIKAPDGSFDFGEITPEIAKVIKRQAGKIRLQVGIESDKEKYGIVHIETGHKKEIESLGYSVADFVLNATRSPDEIRQGNSGSLIMVKKVAGKDNITKLVFVRLKPLKEGDFYCVETAFVKPVAKVAKDYLLLWSASVPHPTDSSYLPPSATASPVKTGEDRSTGTLGQSKDTKSIAQQDKKTSPEPVPHYVNDDYRNQVIDKMVSLLRSGNLSQAAIENQLSPKHDINEKDYPKAVKAFLEGDLSHVKPPKKADIKLFSQDITEGSITPQSIHKSIKKVGDGFRDTAKALLPIMGKNDVRYYLNGIHVDHKNNRLVATNGNMLAIIKGIPDDTPAIPGSFLHNKAAVLSRSAISGQHDDSHWLDEKFPDFSKILQDDYDVSETLNTKDLSNYARGAIKAMSFMGARYNPLMITVDKESFVYDANYVKDIMDSARALGYDSLTAKMGKKSQVLFESEDGKAQFILMPMKVDYSPIKAYDLRDRQSSLKKSLSPHPLLLFFRKAA